MNKKAKISWGHSGTNILKTSFFTLHFICIETGLEKILAKDDTQSKGKRKEWSKGINLAQYWSDLYSLNYR